MQFSKSVIFIVSALLLTGYGRKASTSIDKDLVEVSRDSLILKPLEGLVYYREMPFSGKSIQCYSNENMATSITYVEGKKHGMYVKWFIDGKKSFESNYKNSKQHGTTKTWWPNGNIRSESNFENGVPHGIQKQWYISGTLLKKINLVFGKEQGIQQSWRENGKLYNNYEVKNGRIFGLKRANLCYELENETVKYNE